MVRFVDAADFEADLEDNTPDSYSAFADSEGIPLHNRLFIENINDVETGPWERTNQRGALLHLHGEDGFTDLQIHELRPEGTTERVKHLYDEMIYVTEGSGTTAIGPEDDERIFEWQESSLFCIPSGVPYRHSNGSDDETARLVAKTPLPRLLNVLDLDVLFDPDIDRWDRYSDADLYSTDASLYQEAIGRLAWDADLIPDIQKFDKLEYWDRLGAMKFVEFPMPDSSLHAHIGDIPPYVYKNSHRHSPGATVCALSGEGYSLLWHEGMDERVVIEWTPGAMFTPPARWYHQHFNCTADPARTLALKSPAMGTLKNNATFDAHHPENVISYVEEDDAIRERFKSELATEGLESGMPEECYTDSDFSFKDLYESS